MQFSEILKDLREEKGYTQKEIAGACNLSVQCISALEQGTRNPTGSTILALANFFSISADYLLGRTDELGSVLMPSSPALVLADDERKLLNYYGRMSSSQKIRVIAYCEGMLSTEQNNVSKRNA